VAALNLPLLFIAVCLVFNIDLVLLIVVGIASVWLLFFAVISAVKLAIAVIRSTWRSHFNDPFASQVWPLE
jgi:hypothetical protein